MIRLAQWWPIVPVAIILGLLIWQRRTLWARSLADRLATLCRAGAVLLLLLALAGPQLKGHVDAHYVYFLVDRSASVSAAATGSQLAARLDAWGVARSQTEYGVISFGSQAYVEVPFSPVLQLDAFHSDVGQAGTNVAAAIQLALATFPGDGTKTIVLLSDGQSNAGDLSGATLRAERAGVEVITLPLDTAGQEVAIQGLDAPSQVALKVPFSLRATLYAAQDGPARLVIAREGKTVFDQSLQLHQGLNYVTAQDQLAQAGTFQYTARLFSSGDALPQNNQYQALVTASGAPRILLVEDQAGNPSTLATMLSQAGYPFSVTTLQAFAPNATSLLAYRAVIFDDVSLKALAPDQLDRLMRYVRDLGGGFWLIEGRKAVEGLDGSAIEPMLPVTYEGPQALREPPLALVMVLDRSGSMGEMAGQSQKLALLKEAAIEAVQRLDPRNLVGIIAFSTTYDWVVPLGPIQGRKTKIIQAISSLSASGGTDIYAPLRSALNQLDQVTARMKHVLVFSDGKVLRDGVDLNSLIDRVKHDQVSASSIAIGSQADVQFLWDLAQAGQGTRYQVNDVQDLPKITLEELMRLERARWIKGPVPVEAGDYGYELAGLDPSKIPALGGYALTFPKPTAKTSLVVNPQNGSGDPLLASWQYGLGTVAVLNTAFTAEGMGSWLDWQGLSQLSADVLSQVYSKSDIQPQGLAVDPSVQDGNLTISATLDANGRWLDGAAPSGTLVPAQGDPIALKFSQVAPGTYQASTDGLAEGTYLLDVGQAQLGRINTGLTVPYPEEYRHLGVDQQALTQLADATGGKYLENLANLAPLLQGRAVAYFGIWRPLLFGALGLFILGLAARKLPLGRR